MFIDKTKIYCKAGNGGNGIVSFLRMKGVAKGGPNGGNGGKGGDIIFRADASMGNLSDFYYKVHYRAPNGESGMPNNCNGRGGENMIIRVPVGTVIRDFDTQEIVADMFYDGTEVTVLKGGRGGKGNAAFCTSRRRSPSFSQTGETTTEYALTLELKTIADVGLCGFPNVGKSTLLSVMTAARPKIANYHFTTLSPNLGVANYYDHSFVVADIPGLIEGAAEGAGLGHAFLRHIERTRMLVHVVDMSGSEGRDPYDDYLKIKAELKSYSRMLAALPAVIAANKMDEPNAEENLKAFKKHIRKIPVVPISAAIGEGVKELTDAIWQVLKELPPQKPLEYVPFEYGEKDLDSFEITREPDGSYLVTGGLVEALGNRVILDDVDSFRYFQKQLREKGVIAALREKGAKQGDIVIFSDFEFEFVE